MHVSTRSKMRLAFSLIALAAVVAGLVATGGLRGSTSTAHAAAPVRIDCSKGAAICTEV